jgi:hypothetical protein
VVDDLAALDLDPGIQLVGLPEGVRLVEPVEVLDLLRRRLVVAGDPERERKLRHALDRFGRDPRHGGDR